MACQTIPGTVKDAGRKKEKGAFDGGGGRRASLRSTYGEERGSKEQAPASLEKKKECPPS